MKLLSFALIAFSTLVARAEFWHPLPDHVRLEEPREIMFVLQQPVVSDSDGDIRFSGYTPTDGHVTLNLNLPSRWGGEPYRLNPGTVVKITSRWDGRYGATVYLPQLGIYGSISSPCGSEACYRAGALRALGLNVMVRCEDHCR